MHKVLGEKVVIVNAAGCMTLMATYPYSPIRSSWLYTTMGSVAAGAQGIRDALDIRRAKGELQEQDDLKVLVLCGGWLNLRYGTLGHLGSHPPWFRFLVFVL